MKLLNLLKKKIANSVILVASFAVLNSCSFLFHEEEIPKELEKNNRFVK